MKTTAKLWLAIGILILFSPLGLILPAYFKAGDAWGGRGRGWNAPIPDYAFRGWQEKGLGHLSFAYIISAIAGIVLVAAAMLFIAKLLIKKIAFGDNFKRFSQWLGKCFTCARKGILSYTTRKAGGIEKEE